MTRTGLLGEKERNRQSGSLAQTLAMLGTFLIAFYEFMKKLANLALRGGQGFAAERGGAVHLAPRLSVALLRGAQISLSSPAFEAADTKFPG